MKEKFREYAQNYTKSIKDKQLCATHEVKLDRHLNFFGDKESLD